jgi:predicted nucleic acid-binding protein
VKIVIHDASVLIDLHRCGLLATWLTGGVEAHTSDLVMLEMTQPLHVFVDKGLINVHHLTMADLNELVTFQTHQPRSLSFEDCSVLLLAIQMEAALLTGDADLRRAAEMESVEVHGLLWVLDELVAGRQLSPNRAAAVLQELLKNPRARLPKAECNARLERWRTT